MAQDRDTAVGVFTDLAHATKAVDELRAAGFADGQIGLIAADQRPDDVPEVPESEAGKGAAIGSAVGGAMGAALGLILIALPGGAVAAGGLMAAALGGAAAGGAGGGLVGALLGLNVPEDEAHHCERQLHSGRCVVAVQAGARHDEAAAILRRVEQFDEHHHPTHRASGLSGGGGGDGGGGVFVTGP